MSQGPILIFDKSFLQALSLDESAWLDNFFLNNITPLFFAETLADLEKEVHKGRTPEQVVGQLARKTPDMQAYPSAHHTKLIQGSLIGYPVAMDGRVMIDAGTVVNLNGRLGTFFPPTQVEEAFQRWHKGEFLDVERQIAKVWRRELCNNDQEDAYKFFQNWFLIGKPKTLDETKQLALAYIDGSPQEASLRFGMGLFGIPPDAEQAVLDRWRKEQARTVRDFCPYFHYVYSVDLFFNLAVSADLISRVRPKGKADNKVDIAYLYYLPFCMVFTSNDNLHERVVPLFLRDDQSYVGGRDLKDDLKRIDDYYSLLPPEVKSSGFHKFAKSPPETASILVIHLWDKHMPKWRVAEANHVPMTPEMQKTLLAEIKQIEANAVALHPDTGRDVEMDDLQFAQMNRGIRRGKGKWDRFGPEVK